MRVRGSTTIYEDVEVRPEDMLRALVGQIRYKAKIPGDAFVNHQGMLTIHHDTHGSGYNEEIAPATPEQKKILETIEAFEKLVREACK